LLLRSWIRLWLSWTGSELRPVARKGGGLFAYQLPESGTDFGKHSDSVPYFLRESVQSIMGATENNFSFFPISYRTYRSDRFAILRSSRMCLTSFDLSTHGVAHQRRPVTIIVRTGQDRRRAQALLGTPVPQARQNPRIETVDQPAGQVWTTAGGSPLFSIRKDMDR
jgi:hypothetical protein